MPKTKTLQRSFGGGEVSPMMYGRIDDIKYQTGLARCENFLCLPQGPIENRPGFAFVRACKNALSECRLIPFIFSDGDTIVIELGDHYARFHTHGSTLSSGGSPYEIWTPWAAQDVFALQYTQSLDCLTICHPKYRPVVMKRYSALDWRVEYVNFGAPLAAPEGVSATRATAAAQDENADKYTFKYRVTALNADKTAESAASGTASVVANLYAYGTTVRVSWNAVAGARWYRVYKYSGGTYGFIGDTDELSMIDDNIKAQTGTTPPLYDSAWTAVSGITAVTVTAGGSGYQSYSSGIADQSKSLRFTYTPGSELEVRNAPTGGLHGVGQAMSWIIGSSKARSDAAFAYENVVVSYGAPPDGYPDPVYPAVSVFDLAGPGAGASVEPIWGVDHEATQKSSSYSKRQNGDTVRVPIEVYTRKTITTLTGYRVTARGWGYKRPALRVTYETWTSETGEWKRGTKTCDCEIGGASGGLQVVVQDPTGTGAELSPVVSNGVVTGVNVVRPGSGYSSPTVVFYAYGGGSGAAATASVATASDFPSCCVYHEQRKWFAGTYQHPQQVWATVPWTEDQLAYHLPSTATDRINFRVASGEASRLKHMVSVSGGLVIMSNLTEWRVKASDGGALTPSSVSVLAQSAVGSADVQPLLVNSVVLYAGDRDGHVKELSYNSDAGGYITGDICLRAPHLFDHEHVRDMAFAKAPVPLGLCVSTSGKLLVLTYVPEQKVGSWAQWTTDGAFESVAVVPEDGEDAVYVVVRRAINGATVRYVERLHSRDFASKDDAFFVDSGLEYHGAPKTAFSGLGHLEGKEVSILADGAVMPRQVVTGGRITLEHAAGSVIVGLPFSARARTLPAILQTQDGSFGAGLAKNVNRIHVRVAESSGIWAGPREDRLVEFKQRTTEDPGRPADLKTGDITIVVQPGWSDAGDVLIEQDDPLPLTLVANSLEVAF